ncbi:hypothetical protein TNCV_4481461 [Trichonephila clavipes]|nr:hypothetical protein TNCV_4481461 [Trichonephila clavipes]
MSHYSAISSLLATNLAILNHGQVTKTKPELVHPSPNFHSTPTVGHLSLDIFNVHRTPLHGDEDDILNGSPSCDFPQHSDVTLNSFNVHQPLYMVDLQRTQDSNPRLCNGSIRVSSTNPLGKSLGYHFALFTTNPSEEDNRDI